MSPKPPKKDDPRKPGVRFELEDDADELFRQYIDANPPRSDVARKIETEKDSTNDARQARPRGSIATHQVDLHGCNVMQAMARVDQAIAVALRREKRAKLRIITGKGRHSDGGGVLARDIHAYVRNQYGDQIESIDESPADVALNGLPIRGHFDVILKRY